MTKFSDFPVWIQAFFGASGAFLFTVCGAVLVFFLKGESGKAKSAFGGFSSGVMLSAAFFSLRLPALEVETRLSPAFSVTLGFLCGALLISCADLFFIKGGKTTGGVKLLYASVTLHNVPEGLAVGVAFTGGVLPGLMLALGIGIQNFPEGFCLAYPLKSSGLSTKKSFWLSVLSGAIEIPFAVLGSLLFATGGYMAFALSFAAGAMIAVTATELIAEAFEEKNPLSLVCFTIGFAVIMFLDLFFA